MTDQDKPNEGSLVGGGRRDLAPVAAANPLVSRGIADLAQGRLANVIVPSYLDHRDSLFYYQRMILWDGLDREKKLIEDLNEAIRLDPQNGLLYSKRGSASSGRADHNKAIRDFDKAIQLFDEAIRLHPNNAVAYLHRGDAWLAKEEALTANENYGYEINFDMAIKDFDEAIRLAPNSAFAYIHRGAAFSDKEFFCRGNEDFDEAASYFDKAIEDFNEAIWLDPTCVFAYVERAKAWSFEDDDKAIIDFDEAIELDPVNARLYYHRGEVWRRKRNHDKAIMDYTEVIRLGPTNARAYYARGWAWMAKKDYERALKDFDDYIRIDPRNAFAYRNRGDAWMIKKNYVKAIEDFTEAIRLDLDPQHGFFYYRRAEAWCFEKDFDKAIKDFEQAIERSPTFTPAYRGLARVLAACPDDKIRDGKRAIYLATKACEIDNDWKSGWALDTLAAAYAEAGQFHEAIGHQTKALEDRRQRLRWDDFLQRLRLYIQKKPFRQTREEGERDKAPKELLTPEQRRTELEQLAQFVGTCTRCSELCSTRTRTVFGQGEPGVELCFVGEAPSMDEDAQGVPFVGAAGQLLNRIIAACGLKREEVYLCNVLKCRPPGNRMPMPTELANCRGYLEWQLDLIRPKFICALGAVASQSLLNTNKPVGELRGQFHLYQSIPVLCTYHPALLLRNPDYKKHVWEDMKLLLTSMGRPIPGS